MGEGDIGRVAQGIATGIGFIGAGSILKLPEKAALGLGLVLGGLTPRARRTRRTALYSARASHAENAENAENSNRRNEDTRTTRVQFLSALPLPFSASSARSA